MDATFFHKQGTEPLYGDLLWSRPENRAQAGKLLIIGGNLHGFAAAAQGYQAALKAGVGTARIILPDALQKTVGKLVPEAQFAPSTPSGSFAHSSLASWLENAAWADAVWLAGDLGRNSETASTIENFASKYGGSLVVSKDAVDYFYSQPTSLLARGDTTLVLSLSQLQKLATRASWPHPLTFSMGQNQLVDWLHQFTSSKNQANLVTYHQEQLYVATASQVSATKVGPRETWRTATAAQVAVWWLQNPSQTFAAMTTAVHQAK